MAEIVGLVASCAEIVKLLDETNKFLHTYIHRSSSVKAELVPLLGRLTAYEGLFKAIKLEAEFEDDTFGRLSVLSHVGGPLDICRTSIRAISDRATRLPKHVVFGKVLDDEVIKALKQLDDIRPILELSLQADQRTISKSIQAHVRAVEGEIAAFRLESDLAKQKSAAVLEGINSHLRDAKNTTERREVLTWISQADPSSTFHKTQGQLQPQATNGKWFFTSPQFEEWASGQRQSLWLRGPSGSGKTTLASSVIAELHRRNMSAKEKASIIYFFFDFSDPSKQTAEDMLRSILSQVVQHNDSLYDGVLAFYRDNNKMPLDSNSLETLLDSLHFYQEFFNGKLTYVVIDGLDECVDVGKMTSIFNFKAQKLNSRWFFSCQNFAIVWPTLEDSALIVDMDKSMIDIDIQSYISARFQTEPRLRSFSQEKKDLITNALSQQSNGIFRWASCQLDHLRGLRDRRLVNVRRALESLPADLDQTYRRILNAIRPQDRTIVLRILFFLAFSARPLEIKEVAEFAILEEDTKEIHSEDRFDDLSDLGGLCTSFVDIRGSHITLAHKSIKDFLITQGTGETHEVTVANIHAFIERRCLTYLSILDHPDDSILKMPPGPEQSLRPAFRLHKLCREYPLADYACTAWSYHLERAGIPQEPDRGLRFSSLDCPEIPTIWESWLALQKADIWDNRIRLSIKICEALIRTEYVPDWAKGFWNWRRKLRIVASQPDSKSPSGYVAASSDQPSDLDDLTFLDFGHRLIKQGDSTFDAGSPDVSYHVVVAMIEVALQHPFYFMLSKKSMREDADTLELAKDHIELLHSLVMDVQRQMGPSYADIIRSVLNTIRSRPTLIYDFLPTHDRQHMYQYVVFSLRKIRDTGFRKAIRERVVDTRLKTKNIAGLDLNQIPFAPKGSQEMDFALSYEVSKFSNAAGDPFFDIVPVPEFSTFISGYRPLRLGGTWHP